MARKLKVYRTPIGFHDAYVAASSQKAALEAWGSDADLFARGVAELVTDEALTREPLECPGKVIRLRRGTDAENMAALPKAAKRPQAPKATASDPDDAPPPRPSRRAAAKEAHAETPARSPVSPRRPANPKPKKPTIQPARKRPSRARLDRAETALPEARAKHRATIEALREEERALQRKRRDLERQHEAEVDRLEAGIAKARDAYSEALRSWRG